MIKFKTPIEVTEQANNINYNLKNEEPKNKFFLVWTNKIKAFWLQIKF